jgi:hypothetical protein
VGIKLFGDIRRESYFDLTDFLSVPAFFVISSCLCFVVASAWVVDVRSAIVAWALRAIIFNMEIKINQAKQSQEEVRNLIEFKYIDHYSIQGLDKSSVTSVRFQFLAFFSLIFFSFVLFFVFSFFRVLLLFS